MQNPELSLVIPCYNEETNLRPLMDAIHKAVDPLKIQYEVVITDDCSTDGSWKILKELAAADPVLRIQRFKFNCGESAACWAGIKAARGNVIITLDADLQNDPAEIPKFIEHLKYADCVCGSRVQNRIKGDSLIKVISSKIANSIRNSVIHDDITDAGCTYRAFKRECVANIKMFKGGHRFLPALFKMEGFKVIEIPISNNPRFSGQSHYGIWNRLFKSFLDMLAVRWMQKRFIKYEIADKLNF